jgi:hypothetical protein
MKLFRALATLFPATAPARTTVQLQALRKQEEALLRQSAARHAAFLLEQKERLELLHAELTYHLTVQENPRSIH